MYVIEFRSGTFFGQLDSSGEESRNVSQARKFASKRDAEDYIDRLPWIAARGGIAVDLGALSDRANKKRLEEAEYLLGQIADELLLLRYVSNGGEPYAVRKRIIDYFLEKRKAEESV